MSAWLAGLLHYHPVAVGIVAMWLFSNVVATMPSPTAQSGPWFKWAFALLHSLSGSLPRVVATLAPQYAKLVGAAGVTGESGPASAAEQAPAKPVSGPDTK